MPSFNALNGVRVALLEARMSGEISELVRRYGGVPHCVPAVREAAVDCAAPVASLLDGFEQDGSCIAVFLTGVGASALFSEAERQGRLPLLLSALKRGVVVCRGPKPSAVLKRQGITVAVPVAEPYTSHEVIQAMSGLDLTDRRVTLVHYGERNELLAGALSARGALLDELCLYEWQMPEDLGPLQQMIHDLLGGRFDALVFTSQIQCRHLFRIAADMRLDQPLTRALTSGIVIAAIGPTCRAAVEAFGVTPHVVPAHPKMVPLVASLAEYFERAQERRCLAPDQE